MTENLKRRLNELKFDNRFVNELPADSDLSNGRRQVVGACYSRVLPTPVVRPTLIAHATEVGDLFDLSPEEFESAEFAQVFGGNQLIEGMDPYAMCYGGHQFGNWAGQLGDGRAINLGEVVNGLGDRWALQLKGAGPTPYSRTADGLAVLRSSIREFLCSEAMHHLGVPTTRALSLVLTGEQVMRDMLYDGNPKYEAGAVVCRVAASFIRFGNFQIFAARDDLVNLRRLCDFTIQESFPHLHSDQPEKYSLWFEEVCRRTAEMVIHWMRVGFVHGVMNTDNMSILGLTIDYGPYGWLEDYDPGWTPNTTDAAGKRYRFGNQPLVAHWNLYQLGNAIMPLVGDVESLQRGLEVYLDMIESGSSQMIAEKLGLLNYSAATDEGLKKELFEILILLETDMTIFFRSLAEIGVEQQSEEEIISILREAYYSPALLVGDVRSRILKWVGDYRRRLLKDGLSNEERKANMNRVNPKYVLRNYLAQLAIDRSENGDHTMIQELLDVLRNPYVEQDGKEAFAEKRPEWARDRVGCSMLSCSS